MALYAPVRTFTIWSYRYLFGQYVSQKVWFGTNWSHKVAIDPVYLSSQLVMFDPECFHINPFGQILLLPEWQKLISFLNFRGLLKIEAEYFLS